MKYTELAKKLKEGLDGVYLIEGDDSYFCDSAVAAIRKACDITQPLLNEASVEGDTLKGEALSSFIGTLYTAPMFDERRFVRVNGLYLSERDWETFKKYSENPCPSTVVVIVNTQKKQGVDLKRKGSVTYIDCNKESEETLTRWLFALMRKVGLQPSNDAVSLTVRYCAQDCARMKNETQKLALILGEGGSVTREVVEEFVPKDTEYKIYELTQAASRGNFDAFTSILYELLQKGMDEISVLSALCSHYRTLCEIALSSESDGELAKTLNIKPYALTKNKEIVSRLGGARVRELYKKLYALSSSSKSGRYTKTGALIVALGEIFFD